MEQRELLFFTGPARRIIDELLGSAGESGQTFRRAIIMSNVAEVTSARKDALGCLGGSYAWKTAINLALDELAEDYPTAYVELRLFHPSTGLLTLYYSQTMPEGFRYVPSYSIIASISGTAVRIYAGCLVGVAEPRPLPSIIEEFFHGDVGRLLLTMTWGGHTPIDCPLLQACGLEYASFRFDHPGQGQEFYTLDQQGWKPCLLESPFESYSRHIALHRSFSEDLAQLIDGGTLATHAGEGSPIIG